MKKMSVTTVAYRMQHCIWAKSGAEQPCLPFSGKPGKNVNLEDPINPLECFKFCTPEVVELIVRGSNWNVQTVLKKLLMI
jgi:hypothetical protein